MARTLLFLSADSFHATIWQGGTLGASQIFLQRCQRARKFFRLPEAAPPSCLSCWWTSSKKTSGWKPCRTCPAPRAENLLARKFEQFYRGTLFRQATAAATPGRRPPRRRNAVLGTDQPAAHFAVAGYPVVEPYSAGRHLLAPQHQLAADQGNSVGSYTAVIVGKRCRTAADLFQQQAPALLAPDPDQREQHLQRIRRGRNAAHPAVPEKPEPAATRRNAGRLYHLRCQ